MSGNAGAGAGQGATGAGGAQGGAQGQGGQQQQGQQGGAQSGAQNQSGGQGGSQGAGQGSGQQGGTQGDAGQPGGAGSGQQGQGQSGQQGQGQGQGQGQQGGVPERYTFRVPATAQGLIGDADLKLLETLARQGGWSQEMAQDRLDEDIAYRQLAADLFLQELKAHPEVGGTQLEQTQLLARQALDKFLPESTPEGRALREFMVRTAAGNYTPWVMFLARVGKAMQEDRGPAGTGNRAGTAGGSGGGGGADRDPALVLYGGKA